MKEGKLKERKGKENGNKTKYQETTKKWKKKQINKHSNITRTEGITS